MKNTYDELYLKEIKNNIEIYQLKTNINTYFLYINTNTNSLFQIKFLDNSLHSDTRVDIEYKKEFLLSEMKDNFILNIYNFENIEETNMSVSIFSNAFNYNDLEKE